MMADDKSYRQQPQQQQQQQRYHPLRSRTRFLILILASIVCIASAIFLSDKIHRRLPSLTIPFRSVTESTDKSNNSNVANGMTIAINETATTVTTKPDHVERTYPQISSLPPSLLPKPPSESPGESRRLIVIGDVHGHLESLKALLRKAKYSASHDTVVFTGDMVNKGPDSAGVIAFAMEIGAFAVRGNHEDRVMKAWERYTSKRRAHTNGDDSTEVTEEKIGVSDKLSDGRTESETQKVVPSVASPTHEQDEIKEKREEDTENRKSDLETAKSLTPAQRKWISKLPIILRIGPIDPKYGEDVVVVHAGLVPGIPFESQDPEAVMNMRTLLPGHSRSKSKKKKGDKKKNPKKSKPWIPSPSRDGIPWAEVWSSAQTSSSDEKDPATTVIYGHDAKMGVKLREYAFGLDSGCGQDRALTGIIFEARGAKWRAQGDEEGDETIDDDDDEFDDNEQEEADKEYISHSNKKSKARIRHHLVSVSCMEIAGNKQSV